MDSLIETFHLDVKLIIAQLVNFIIVMLVLWFGAFKPLSKVMGERTQKIEKSLAQAKEIEDRLTKTDVERENILKRTKSEASLLLEKANKDAEKNKQELAAKTKAEVEKLVAEGKKQLAAEKEKMVAAAKAEVGDLVVEATKKVLGSVLTKEVDKKVIEEALKEIK